MKRDGFFYGRYASNQLKLLPGRVKYPINNGGICIAVRKMDDGRLAWGTSFCVLSDNFNKNIARNKSYGKSKSKDAVYTSDIDFGEVKVICKAFIEEVSNTNHYCLQLRLKEFLNSRGN